MQCHVLLRCSTQGCAHVFGYLRDLRTQCNLPCRGDAAAWFASAMDDLGGADLVPLANLVPVMAVLEAGERLRAPGVLAWWAQPLDQL